MTRHCSKLSEFWDLHVGLHCWLRGVDSGDILIAFVDFGKTSKVFRGVFIGLDVCYDSRCHGEKKPCIAMFVRIV